VIFLILVLTMAPLMAAYELCDNRIAESELEIIDVIDVNQTNECLVLFFLETLFLRMTLFSH